MYRYMTCKLPHLSHPASYCILITGENPESTLAHARLTIVISCFKPGPKHFKTHQ